MKKYIIILSIMMCTAKVYAPPPSTMWEIKVVNDRNGMILLSNVYGRYYVPAASERVIKVYEGTYYSYQDTTVLGMHGIGDNATLEFNGGGYITLGYSTPWQCFWQGFKVSGVLAMVGYGVTLFMRGFKTAATVD